MRKCKTCKTNIDHLHGQSIYCKDITCKRKRQAQYVKEKAREKSKEFKKSDKYKEMIIEGPFVCVWQECKEPFYTKRKAWTTLGKPTKPRPIQSRQKACSQLCQRNAQGLKAKRRSPGIAQNGSARIHKDENGDYPTATCPYCQETFERRFGHRQKVCQKTECQKGWKLFQSSWNRLYGSIKDWPPLFENDINKREYSRTCKHCKEVFTFRTYPDTNGNPIASAGKREFCSYKKTGGDQCFDVYYRTHLPPEQREKYRASGTKANKKGRDNLEDWYVKGGIQRQLIKDGFHIPSNEFCQSMIDDKRVLLAAKRAYAKATGQNIQRSSYR
jgi:hypothetical protein